MVRVPEPVEVPAASREEQMKSCIGDEVISGVGEKQLVCVTSASSYFGSQLLRKLLACGYLVRATIQTAVDYEEMKDVITEEEMRQVESVVVASMADLESLCSAFTGCHAIFHTSSFVDPHGISGYTEQMAFVETQGASNVIEACARAASVKKCIFTSSLLASIWTGNERDKVIDENCWSDEEFCRENKLWAALGKTRAEKIAWRKSKELEVKLVTVCLPLLMAPSFPNAHVETSIPYLKGGQQMLKQGILAVVDVNQAVEEHLRVYEAIDDGACSRYICYGKIVRTVYEATQLENNLKMHSQLTGEGCVINPRFDEIPYA